MDLLENPFYSLNATPRDNRRRILELADERSLLLDSCTCMEARSILTTPRKRLASEIAWLPGLGPKRASEVLLLLKSSTTSLLTIDNLPSIARSNLLVAGLIRFSNYNTDVVAKWVLEIAWTFEQINPKELSAVINEDRIVSGFPEVTDLSLVEAEVQERRRYYCKVIKAALNNLAARELVKTITFIVESATENGEKHGPILIADLVDLYEVEAQDFLTKEETNIITLVNRLQVALNAKKSDSILASIVGQLIQIAKNWDTVAQPIQISAKSRGLKHTASWRIAYLVRTLSIRVFNEFGKIEFSQQLTNMLQEVFAEVGEVAEHIATDADTLEDIAKQRSCLIEEAKNRAEKWQKEITYEAHVGLIFKRILRISPEGIEWKGHYWELNSITRIRWGGVQHSVNGIPVGITYDIVYGDNSNYASIKLRQEAVYSNFVGRLWKTVGTRLLIQYLEGLKEGNKYRFGSTIMHDYGMVLECKKFLSDRERVFCRWDELIIWNGTGTFCIGKKNNKELIAILSYRLEDNIHILETAIRMFWKQRRDRISSLLEELK